MSILTYPKEPGPEELRDPPDTWYFPVSVTKFIGMSVFTVGMYPFYWFYRNWRFVGDRYDREVWPLVRTFFSPIFYFSLLDHIDRHHPDSGSPKSVQWILAGAYLAANVASGLPDPYWLVSMFAFVPLLPAVVAINRMNDPERSEMAANSRWRLRHVPLVLVGGLLLLLVVADATSLLPSASVIPGSELRASDIRFLRSEGLIAEGEEVVYFYADGVVSLRAHGVILSDRRLVTYWNLGSDDPYYADALFETIQEVDVTLSTAWYENTYADIILDDGSRFTVMFAPDAGADQFFDELARRRAR